MQLWHTSHRAPFRTPRTTEKLMLQHWRKRDTASAISHHRRPLQAHMPHRMWRVTFFEPNRHTIHRIICIIYTNNRRLSAVKHVASKYHSHPVALSTLCREHDGERQRRRRRAYARDKWMNTTRTHGPGPRHCTCCSSQGQEARALCAFDYRVPTLLWWSVRVLVAVQGQLRSVRFKKNILSFCID